MSIVEYIPTGKDNAISRSSLAAITGMPDREIREAISIARRDHAILNTQNGQGYFLPAADETQLVERWVLQEKRRAKSIFWSMRGALKIVTKAETADYTGKADRI